MQSKALDQLKQLWAKMNPRQRLIIGGGTLLTLLAVGLLVRTMATPDFKPLMTGLEPADAQAISQQLAAKKIEYRPSTDGKGIDVPADQLDAARMEVASQGTTHSGRLGFELFDKASWGQTEFDEKVNYQRAMEGELERTISTLKDVKSARVHLVLSRSSVFLDRERAAKASVTLRMKRGTLNQEELDAISRLVSGAVEDLAPTDVAIIDADSNEPMGKHTGDTQGRELEDELSKRLMTTLGPAVGAENLRTSVNVEYDMSSSEENQDKYDPAVSALLSTQKTREQAGDGAATAGGVAGTSGNLGTTPSGNQGAGTAADQNTAGSDAAAQLTTSENSTYGVDKLQRHTVKPSGRIKRVTAAILVNDEVTHKMVGGKVQTTSAHRTDAQLKQIETLAGAVLGVDSKRGDVVSVQNMAFTSGDPELPPTMAQRVQKGMNDFATPLRYASLLALFLMAWALLFRPLQKQLVASMKELPAGSAAMTRPPETATGLPAEDIDRLMEPDTTDVGLKRRLTEMVQAEPIPMTRTLQAWLQEEQS
ncbi:MAG: flagellar basal-body MS-ring/collar protein FliF [Janthinobacterium lividum]